MRNATFGPFLRPVLAKVPGIWLSRWHVAAGDLSLDVLTLRWRVQSVVHIGELSRTSEAMAKIAFVKSFRWLLGRLSYSFWMVGYGLGAQIGHQVHGRSLWSFFWASIALSRGEFELMKVSLYPIHHVCASP